MPHQSVLLVNPHADRGRAAQRLEFARAALAAIGNTTVELTRGAGDEARIAQHAIEQDARALFVLGGDGTISRAAQTLVNAASRIPLAILAAGTGNDFAKSLGAPVHDYRAMAGLVADNAIRTIDAGRVDDCVFVNSCGFGFDVEVQKQTLRPSRLRGNAVYMSAALRQLFRYGGFNARVEQGGASYVEHWLTLVFANGGWFGGNFRIAPDARIDDGALDCIAIGDASPWRRARLFADAPRGAHVRHGEVRVIRADRFQVHFDDAPMFQADGELHQASSARVEIVSLPNALRIACPWRYPPLDNGPPSPDVAQVGPSA